MYKVMIAFIFLWLTLLIIKALVDMMETEIIYGRKFIMGKHDRRKKYFDDIMELIGSETNGCHDIRAEAVDNVSDDIDAIVEEYFKMDVKATQLFLQDNEYNEFPTMCDENEVIFE